MGISACFFAILLLVENGKTPSTQAVSDRECRLDGVDCFTVGFGL